MNKNLAFSLLLLLFPGCVEEYDLYRDDMEPRLVVEGLITNKPGPYYIRLTESKAGSFVEPDYGNIDDSKPVKDAILMISDNVDQVDTLIPVVINPDEYTLDRYGYYKLLYDDEGNVIDTLFMKDPSAFNYERGFYKTQHLTGITGRTYTLKIISEGKEYQATSFMPSVPEIDSLGYLKKVMDKDNEQYFIPLLYFSEPQGISNYYLIQLNEEVTLRTYSASTLWQFSVLSDEFLPENINGLEISLGETPRSIEYPMYWEGDSMYLALSSLTREGYEYYKSLLQQFKNDGGAYQASPASPPTNISNGGLGFFRASAVSEKRLRIPRSF